MLVRIIKWDYPDLGRQTPGGSFQWQDITFTEEPVEVCDHVLVLNHAAEPVRVRCSPDRVWAIIGEPPVAHRLGLHAGLPAYSRIYMQDPTRLGPRYVASHGALPWRVTRTYDDLIAMPCPDKPRGLSWITSTAALVPGHDDRRRFLTRLQAARVELDLYGRGIREIPDKWDGLAPYRYTLAIENHVNPYYWTEKVVDALLAWTLPLYYGCTALERWIPAEAFIRIDIRDPEAPEQVRAIAMSDTWSTRLEAIADARRRILTEHQLFPFMHRELHQWLSTPDLSPRPPRDLTFEAYPDTRPGWAAAVRRTCARALRPVASPGLRQLGRRLWPR